MHLYLQEDTIRLQAGRTTDISLPLSLSSLLEAGLHVKTNTVVMKGVNEHEIVDFVGLTKDLPIHVRFIEFMPFQGNQWEHEQVFPANRMLELIGEQYSFIKLRMISLNEK